MGCHDIESAGLSVPTFSSELRQELARFAFGPGSSVSNPVDSAVVTNPSLFSKAMRIMASSNEVDLLLVHLPLDISHIVGDSDIWKVAGETVLETSQSLDIPMVVVQPHTAHPGNSAGFYALQQRCVETSLPLYSSAGQAACAISRYIQYHLWRSR